MKSNDIEKLRELVRFYLGIKEKVKEIYSKYYKENTKLENEELDNAVFLIKTEIDSKKYKKEYMRLTKKDEESFNEVLTKFIRDLIK